MSGGRILDLPGGARAGGRAGADRRPAARRDAPPRRRSCSCTASAAPFTGGTGWSPLLARRHRVIRIDLLGFGGSEKPKSGYSMEDQGRLVALALGRLAGPGRGRRRPLDGVRRGDRARRASPASWSTAWSTSTTRPDPSFGDLPFLARLTFTPVIGQALRRIAPDFAIKDGYESAFAPGYDLGDFSDQVVDDYRAMTYTSYDRSPAESDDYEDELPLDQRVRDAAVPLLVIFGEEDQLYDDPDAAAQAYGDVPGARITIIPGRRPLAERREARPDLPPDPRLRGAAGGSPPRPRYDASLASGHPLSPTRPGGPRRRSRRGRDARRGGGRAGHGPRRAPRRTASSWSAPWSIDEGSVISPASQ